MLPQIVMPLSTTWRPEPTLLVFGAFCQDSVPELRLIQSTRSLLHFCYDKVVGGYLKISLSYNYEQLRCELFSYRSVYSDPYDLADPNIFTLLLRNLAYMEIGDDKWAGAVRDYLEELNQLFIALWVAKPLAFEVHREHRTRSHTVPGIIITDGNNRRIRWTIAVVNHQFVVVGPNTYKFNISELEKSIQSIMSVIYRIQ